MELPELRAGIGAQLGGENVFGPRIGLQRLGWASAVMQRPHEQIPHPFV